MSLFSISNAKTIQIINTGSLTGNTMFYAKEISKVLENSNLKNEIKTIGDNCALSKMLWDKTSDPILLFAGGDIGNADKDIANCYIKPTVENTYYWILSTPYYFCSSSANGKKLNDFLVRETQHKIATFTNNQISDFFKHLDKTFGVSTKIIKLGNNATNLAINMAKSNEVDFTFMPGTLVSSRTGGDCFFSTIEDQNYKTLDKILDQFNNSFDTSSITTDFYIFGKNFEKRDEIVSLIQKAWMSKEWSELRSKRSHNDSIIMFNSKLEYEKKIKSLVERLNK
jgi:hypothetical protein